MYDSTLVSGTSTTGKVRLSAVAPKNGATVTLTSSLPSLLTVPATITIPEGASLGIFTAAAANVVALTTATITATLGASSSNSLMTLKPNATSSTGTVYLFLHGLNSDPSTWKDLIKDRFKYCDQLKVLDPYPYYRAEFDKQIYAWDRLLNLNPFPQANGCYALEFSSPGWDSGDGLNYAQLGLQVGAAVNFIVKQRNPSAIIFVGHSRGGLAARAFLQQYQSRDELAYKVGLITIGTPHRGSPFGRVKWWMDQNHYTWDDTLQRTSEVLTAIALLSPEDPLFFLAALGTSWIRQEVKFVFSPSVANFATYHDASGALQLCADPVGRSMCELNAQSSRLNNVVSSAGQIVSTGMKLGENVIWNFDVLSPLGYNIGAILPGNNVQLRNYVFQNITAGAGAPWSEDTDSIVPAESQRLDVVAPKITPLTSRYLVRIKHTSETGCTDCINQVLDALIGQLRMPVNQMGVKASAKQTATRGARADDEQDTDSQTRETRGRIRLLNSDDLVQTAIEGDRLNNLEGLLGRREIRQREGAAQREIVAGIRQRLQRPDQETRARAARLLADVPAEHSGEIVIELLRSESDPLVRSVALKTVRTLAAEATTADDRRYLSENLQRMAEKSADSDPGTFLASVDSLVALGGAEDIEKLLDLHRRSNEARRLLLADRMAGLRNREGAQRLAAYLAADPQLQQEQTRLAGEVLSEMSTEESVGGLLDWASGIDTEPQMAEAVRWLRKVRTTRGKERLATVVQQGRFKSEVLRENLQKVLSTPGQCTPGPATPIPSEERTHQR
jgi:pimeloyl-ACP methyl ester carboxylesterase